MQTTANAYSHQKLEEAWSPSAFPKGAVTLFIL